MNNASISSSTVLNVLIAASQSIDLASPAAIVSAAAVAALQAQLNDPASTTMAAAAAAAAAVFSDRLEEPVSPEYASGA
jgi:hypothetical protein